MKHLLYLRMSSWLWLCRTCEPGLSVRHTFLTVYLFVSSFDWPIFQRWGIFSPLNAARTGHESFSEFRKWFAFLVQYLQRPSRYLSQRYCASSPEENSPVFDRLGHNRKLSITGQVKLQPAGFRVLIVRLQIITKFLPKKHLPLTSFWNIDF